MILHETKTCRYTKNTDLGFVTRFRKHKHKGIEFWALSKEKRYEYYVSNDKDGWNHIDKHIKRQFDCLDQKMILTYIGNNKVIKITGTWIR